MRTDVTLPSLAPTMTEGRLGNWLKQVGDAVRAGEPIAEIESEKTVTELESPTDGYLVEILVDANTEEIPVGAVLARIADTPPAGAREAATRDTPTDPDEGEPTALVAMTTVERDDVPATTSARGVACNATPLAARVARLLDLDTDQANGTGPDGRIMLRDLSLPRVAPAMASPAPKVAQPARVLVPHNAHRRITARRLTEAKQRIPHFYLQTKVNADRLLQMRAEVNAPQAGNEPLKISINDCVVRAVAMALARLPEVNVAWTDEGLLPNAGADVAVAVATPAGLVTPVLRSADTLTLTEISRRTRQFAERARSNSLAPDEYQGGSCTVSNLGMFGVDSLYAIVNPPQSFIVGVGRVVEEPVVRSGVVTAGSTMQCTLSGDHRAIDGVTGARLLGVVRELLECPSQLLL